MRPNKCIPVALAILFMVILGCSNQSSEQSTAPSVSSAPADPPSPATKEVPEIIPLVLGSIAPKLELTHWVQGQPVDTFEPGHTYVVEFWATWCGPCKKGMPHISKLQEKHLGKVTFVGVTAEKEKVVTKFLGKTQDSETGKTWGEVVTYALALDSKQATIEAYMEAAGQEGIPCAFVVGPDAHIEWMGHPKDIDEPLELIVAGTWDRDEYLVRFERKEAMRKQKKEEEFAVLDVATGYLDEAKKSKDWGKAIAEIDKILQENPNFEFVSEYVIKVKLELLMLAKQFDDAIALSDQLAKENWKDAYLLNDIAWILSTNHSGSDMALEKALQFAERACERRKYRKSTFLDTLARVYYELGNLDEAISWQEKAVANTKKPKKYQKRLQRYLDERDGERDVPAEAKVKTESSVDLPS